MLEYMKLSQLAAFYLGIALTVISLATTLLALKYAKKLNSFAKAISLCLIAPFLACTSWLICCYFTFFVYLRYGCNRCKSTLQQTWSCS